MTFKLTKDEVSIINNPIQLAKGLPSRCYTSKEGSKFDCATTLALSWTCLGHFSNLKPGCYQTIDIFGMPLAIVSDNKGVNRVFHNVCRHRGHKLLESSGSLNGVIKCPYHSWIYKLNGALKATPLIGGYGDHTNKNLDFSKYGLHEVKSDNWFGLTFININGNEIDLNDHLTPLINRWKRFLGPHGFKELSNRSESDSTELTVNANWKLVVENYIESYHLPWVHPTLNTYSKIEHHYNIIINKMAAGQGTKQISPLTGTRYTLPKFLHWPEKNAQYGEYIAIFPNLLLGIHIDHVFSIVLQPLAPDKTLEKIQLSYIGVKKITKKHVESKKRLLNRWCSVFKEDVLPLEGMQKGRESKAFDGGIFSPKLETATHEFHKWVASKYVVYS